MRKLKIMFQQIKYLLKILALSLVLAQLIECQKYQCKKESNAADVFVTDYFLFAGLNRKFPTNQNELKKFCKEDPDYVSKIELHIEKCFDNLTKRLGSLLFYSIKKTNANICRSKRKTSEFIGMGRCGNTANKANKKCWNKWMTALNGIILANDHKLKMPLTCCVTYNMKNCFSQSYDNNPKVCPQKAIGGLENLFGSYVTDTMGLFCGDYSEDNDKCDQIINKIPKTKIINNSPIAILSAIFDSFPEHEV